MDSVQRRYNKHSVSSFSMASTRGRLFSAVNSSEEMPHGEGRIAQ